MGPSDLQRYNRLLLEKHGELQAAYLEGAPRSSAVDAPLPRMQGATGRLTQTTYDGDPWHVTKLVVCNPRRNALLKEGSKSDRIDARKLQVGP